MRIPCLHVRVPCLVVGLALLGSCGGGNGGNGDLPPVAVTLAGPVLQSVSAETVSGSIDTKGQDTEYWFEWGTDAALASPSRTTTASLVASSSVQTVNETLTGLAAGTKYFFRLVAQNPSGTSQGQVNPMYHYANIVFVTSSIGTGNLGSWTNAGGATGMAAGDAVCQALASAAGLPGSYRAWLSDSTASARDRMAHSNAAYMRVDGVRIGTGWSDLTGASYLDNPVDRDEQGRAIAGERVWTHTRPNSTSGYGVVIGDACLNWTSSNITNVGVFGSTDSSNFLWTEAAAVHCEAANRLYCFQQNTALPQEHCSTGCAGPLGWVWHVSACSKGLYQDPDCRYVCCHFYSGTSNCNNVPATFGGYTVNGCSYNTGVYSMSVTHSGQSFNVSCEVE